MNIRKKNNKNSIAVQSAELAFAIPQVVSHRIARMALSDSSPSDRDLKEFKLMGAEKIWAFNESWFAMVMQAWRANQHIVLRAWQSFWSPWMGIKNRHTSPAKQLNKAVAGIISKGMEPVSRRAVANAKRLSRVKIKG